MSEESESTCEICCSDKFIDVHHYDCREGKLSPETIMLCRRCHRTYHDRGIEWFDDDKLDKAIQVENNRREIWNLNLDKLNEERLASSYMAWRKPLNRQEPLKQEDIQRSDYWNKIHGIGKRRQPPREKADEKQLGFGIIDNLTKQPNGVVALQGDKDDS